MSTNIQNVDLNTLFLPRTEILFSGFKLQLFVNLQGGFYQIAQDADPASVGSRMWHFVDGLAAPLERLMGVPDKCRMTAIVAEIKGKFPEMGVSDAVTVDDLECLRSAFSLMEQIFLTPQEGDECVDQIISPEIREKLGQVQARLSACVGRMSLVSGMDAIENWPVLGNWNPFTNSVASVAYRPTQGATEADAPFLAQVNALKLIVSLHCLFEFLLWADTPALRQMHGSQNIPWRDQLSRSVFQSYLPPNDDSHRKFWQVYNDSTEKESGFNRKDKLMAFLWEDDVPRYSF